MNAPGLNLCIHCRHIRVPPESPTLDSGPTASPHEIEAATQAALDRKERAQVETAKLNAGQPFVTEPHHFAWCARFTLTDAEIEEIDRRRRLRDPELARHSVNGRFSPRG